MDLPESEWVQVLITGMATAVEPPKMRKKRLQSTTNRKEQSKKSRNRNKIETKVGVSFIIDCDFVSSPDDEELIFNLEDEDQHHHELSTSMTNLSPNSITGSGGMAGKHQTSLPNSKYRNKSAPTTAPAMSNNKFKFPRPVSEGFICSI